MGRYETRGRRGARTVRLAGETRMVDEQPHDVEVVNDEEVAVPAEPVRPPSWITREPVAVQAVIQAALAMALGFGIPVTTEQMGLILGFTAALLALITRQSVTPFEATGKALVDKNKISNR